MRTYTCVGRISVAARLLGLGAKVNLTQSENRRICYAEIGSMNGLYTLMIPPFDRQEPDRLDACRNQASGEATLFLAHQACATTLCGEAL